MMNSHTQDSAPCPVVTIEGQYYALLRQFRKGALSVVWQAQLIPTEALNSNGYFHEKVEGKDLMAFLQKENDLDWEPNTLLGNDLVAIKIPNPEEVPNLPHEAKNLCLRDVSERSHRLVELKKDYSRNTDCPCLILAWAKGIQLDTMQEPLAEPDALFMAFQVVQATEAIFTKRFIPLTDSLKPNSIFWDATNRQVTIIDLGLVGENMADLESLTFPIFGDMLHFALTKNHAGTQLEKGAPIPNQLGLTPAFPYWRSLSYGTRLIVKQIFDRSFLPQPTIGLRGNDLYAILSKAIGNIRAALETQISLWNQPLEELLKKARRAFGTEAVNLFDIVWARGQAPLEYDVQAYQKQWQKLAEQWLEELPLQAKIAQIKQQYASLPDDKGMQLAAVLLTNDLNWVHNQYPREGLFRRANLVIDTAFHSANQDWEQLQKAVKLLSTGDAQVGEQQFTAAIETFTHVHTLLAGLQLAQKLQALVTEANFLATWSQAKAVLVRKRFPADDLESIREWQKTAEALLAELRGRYADESILEQWQADLDALKLAIEKVEKDIQEKSETIQSQLTKGEYTNAETSVQEFEAQFTYGELARWKETINHGKKIVASLDTIAKTGERPARKNALAQLCASWAALCTAWPDNEQLLEYDKELQKAVAQHLSALILLNQYAEATTWLDRLQDNTIKHDLRTERDGWNQKHADYEQIVQQYETAANNREKSQQRAKAALTSADYASYMRASHEWREQTKQAVRHLNEAIKNKFYFLPLGGSVHLTQSALLHEVGQHDEAQQIAAAGQPVFNSVLEESRKGNAWLTKAEEIKINSYFEQAIEFQAKQPTYITSLSRDIVRYYLRQKPATDGPPAHYLVRLGLLKLDLLDNTSTQIESELTNLQTLAENEQDDELALSYVSLALVTSPGNERIRAQFKKMSDRWLKAERKELESELAQSRQELNRDIVGELQRLFVRERLGHTLDAIENLLQALVEKPLEQPPHLIWLALTQNIRDAESLLNMQSLLPTKGNKLDDSEGSVQTESNESRFASMLKRIPTILAQQIMDLVEETIEEKANLNTDLVLHLIAIWEETLRHLETELRSISVLKLDLDWEGLQKQLVISKETVKMTQMILNAEAYLSQGNYQAACKQYEQFAQLSDPMAH
jgi:hypothetical protein